MKQDLSDMQKGAVTRVSPSYVELLRKDSRKPHFALLESGAFVGGGGPVPKSRYFDPDFARLEMERVWMKTWQFAARAEDIPQIGDRVAYDVGDRSFMIVRSGENEFKAFYNSCLHRGVRLCVDEGFGPHIQCPFHGWTWNVDGTVKNLPGLWDFPGVGPETHKLPEAKCDVWAGNIFINPDPKAGPLRDALGVLPEHFKDYDFENRWSVVRVRKKVRANWKVVMEAFLEGWHLSVTHKQAQSWNGDSSTKYDIWEDEGAQVSRSITPSAVPSPELGDGADPRLAIIETIKAVTPPGVDLPDFDKIENLDRAFAAEWRRNMLSSMTGRDFSAMSDAEMLDAVQYFMFPNFFPWLYEGAPLFYQFTPYKSDPNCSVMEIRFLLPLPADGKKPPVAERVELDFDETYQDRQAGFGLFDEVFDQDMSNTPLQQLGLKASAPDRPYVELGRYQECRIQAFHARLAKIVGL